MAFIIPAKSAAGESRKELGVCVLCETTSTCAYTKDSQRPVLQCEELLDYEYAAIPTASKIVSSLTDPVFRFSPIQKMQRVL